MKTQQIKDLINLQEAITKYNFLTDLKNKKVALPKKKDGKKAFIKKAEISFQCNAFNVFYKVRGTTKMDRHGLIVDLSFKGDNEAVDIRELSTKIQDTLVEVKKTTTDEEQKKILESVIDFSDFDVSKAFKPAKTTANLRTPLKAIQEPTCLDVPRDDLMLKVQLPKVPMSLAVVNHKVDDEKKMMDKMLAEDKAVYKASFLTYIKDETKRIKETHGDLEWDSLRSMITSVGFDKEVRDELIGSLITTYVLKYDANPKRMKLFHKFNAFMIKNGA